MQICKSTHYILHNYKVSRNFDEISVYQWVVQYRVLHVYNGWLKKMLVKLHYYLLEKIKPGIAGNFSAQMRWNWYSTSRREDTRSSELFCFLWLEIDTVENVLEFLGQRFWNLGVLLRILMIRKRFKKGNLNHYLGNTISSTKLLGIVRRLIENFMVPW